MLHPLLVHPKRAWAALRVYISLTPAQIAEREVMTALTKTTASLATLQAAIARQNAAVQANASTVANASTTAAALADAQAQLASIDDSLSEQIDAISASVVTGDASADTSGEDASADATGADTSVEAPAA